MRYWGRRDYSTYRSIWRIQLNVGRECICTIHRLRAHTIYHSYEEKKCIVYIYIYVRRVEWKSHTPPWGAGFPTARSIARQTKMVPMPNDTVFSRCFPLPTLFRTAAFPKTAVEIYRARKIGPERGMREAITIYGGT